jgi:hypothetical protein
MTYLKERVIYGALALLLGNACAGTWPEEESGDSRESRPSERPDVSLTEDRVPPSAGRAASEERVSPADENAVQGGGYEDLSGTVPLQNDPATGIPYATIFQHAIAGSDNASFGFCFGEYNESFPGKYHTGCDYLSRYAPYGAAVRAPADGIVRISTDIRFGYYGSDSGANPDNLGCVLAFEHLLPNGQPVTSLLGHVMCESGTAYDPDRERGNPAAGSIVRRGQYVGHVAHYWHGASRTSDMPHIHEGFRRGGFDAASYTRSGLAPYVQGYAPVSEFTTEPSGKKSHPVWIDPLDFVQAHGDPITFQNGNVLHHPSGSLLTDGNGNYWMVVSGTEIAYLPRDVIASDRYDTSAAVRVSDEEIACYAAADPVRSLGEYVLYRRPFTNSIVVAYPDRGERFDIIRWEAFVSWGFTQGEIQEGFLNAMYYEWFYNPEGYRTMRPGALVKGHAETEVSIVTRQGTRLPVFSGEVFETLGFDWNRVVTIPQEVLDAVAGPRESVSFGTEALTFCPALPSCADGGACGGGYVQPVADPDPEQDPDPVADPDPPPADSDPEPDPEPFCAPGISQACACGEGMQGMRVCLQDGSGYDVCQCPDPEPVVNPDSELEPVADPDPDPDPAADPAPPADPASSDPPADESAGGQIRLRYVGDVSGEIVLMAWWRNPDGSARSWNPVTECADADPSDMMLECDLPVLSGSLLFEFQINLPNGAYWGDHSCSSGGCDAPVGTLTLTRNGSDVPYVFVPNNAGAPYYNGYLAPVP